MTGIQFARATKEKAKARIALAGPSGGGKTYTALTVASILTPGSVAVCDTERGSASKYADEFAFDTFEPESYSPELLIDALVSAGAAGYGTFIVDSLSHFWMGADGMLEQVDRAGKRAGGNSFGGWKEMRPIERRMVDAMLAYPGHVIATMRTKTEWVVEQNERGKSAPKRIGTKAEQRDGIEYEFDVVGDLSLENELMVTKTRCPALKRALIREPGAEFAETIREWLEAGVDRTDEVAAFAGRAQAEGMSYGDLLNLFHEVERRRLLDAGVAGPDGAATTLGLLIKTLGAAAKDREQAGAES